MDMPLIPLYALTIVCDIAFFHCLIAPKTLSPCKNEIFRI